MATKVNINANIESENHYTTTGEKSLKSLRTYQLGVVYKDVYGRETPVFTNEDASLTISKNFSDDKNSIVTQVKNPPPVWADSYKYFIKETSNEYYNICMDRWYDAEDDNMWLSFPSAERNKIQEDGYIILKKKAGTDEAIHEEGRYRVIDIQNEAPDFIKTDYEKYGESTITVLSANPGSTTIQLEFTDGGSNDWDDSVFFDSKLVDNFADPGTQTGFIGWPLEDVVIDLSIVGARTGWLDVANIYKSSELFIQLSKPLEGEIFDAGTTEETKTGGILSVLPTGAGAPTVKIAKKIVKNKPEFNGHFFVKVRRDVVIEDYIRSVGNPRPSFNVKQSMQYWCVKGTQYPNYNHTNFWKGIGEKFLIDRVKRRSVGTGGGTGKKGPYVGDDGYGITGNRSTHMGAYSMDLTFQKIKDSTKDGFSTASNTQSKKDFINKMKTTGTMFRFKEDPFQHIYIIDYARYTGDDKKLNGNGIWNYGTKKSQRKDKDNKAHRLYLRFKTTGYQLHLDQASGGTYADFEQIEETKGLYPFQYGHLQQTSKEFVPSTAGNFDVWYPTLKGYGKYGQATAANNQGSGTPSTTVWDDLEQTTSLTNSFNIADMSNTIEIVDTDTGDVEPIFSKNPAIWETEPKEDIGLDIYYEASQAYPLTLTNQTNELFAPYGCIVTSDDKYTPNGLVEHSFFVPVKNDIDVDEIGQATGTSFDLVLTTANTEIILGMTIKGPGLSSSIDYIVTNISTTTITMSSAATSTSGPNAVFHFTTHNTVLYDWAPTGHGGDTVLLNVKTDAVGYTQQQLQPSPGAPNTFLGSTTGIFSTLNTLLANNVSLRFTRLDGSYTTAKIKYFSGWHDTNNFINPTGYTGNSTDYVLIKLDRDLSKTKIKLPYFNCYSFGNGVESDRIRDDFNAVRLDKGVKASTILDEPYEEEQRTSGLIYSGIYNSNSGVNNLNQFIAAEKITKDAPPSYGSIQKLKARDTNLVAFCEDKVLKIQAYKDALYKADGNPDIISTNKVLGDITTFAGEFGISKNPESYAEESFRMYFTDKQRGKVLRLSGDGITPISDVGMKDFFADNLKLYDNLIGSFDDRKGEYNLTMTKNIRT